MSTKGKVSYFTLVMIAEAQRRQVGSVCTAENRNLQNLYLSEKWEQ
jgi:hypothetical protein